MMLKDEINSLTNVNMLYKFLENSKCGFLLEQLIRMPDIQIYFKKVILKTIEKMEIISSYKKIDLSVVKKFQELNNYVIVQKKKLGKKFNLEKVCRDTINSQMSVQSINCSIFDFESEDNDIRRESYSQEMNEFKIKNLADVNFNIFKERAEEAKDGNKTILFEYYKGLINEIKSSNNPELFGNGNLMDNLINTKMESFILPLYYKDFIELKSFVEQLIEDIMINLHLLPNSIKYICKIISILIKKKFNNITKIQENAFISKFIIGKLLIPIISNPSRNAFISNFIISGNTINNIKILNIIIKQIFSGKLFLNVKAQAEYTPFNWVLIDNMDKILKFFENSVNVNLPNFIEKCINEELPNDYSYDYFKENKEEIYASISVCFTIDNLFNLIWGLDKCKDILELKNPKINKLKRVLAKLKTEEAIKEMREVDSSKKISSKDKIKKNEKNMDNELEPEIKYYYLYIDHIIEDKYNNLFSINNNIANFYINIKNLEKSKVLDENNKNIIKVKNYLCSSLGNYRLLNISDFNIGDYLNTKKLLNEIKSYMSLPNFILNNNTIPSIWYINSILEYLDKIPQDYKENDYQKLFAELTQDINKSINSLDFGILILFRNKLKFIDKINDYYDNIKELFNNIIFNENVKNIVENAFIPIDVMFIYTKKEKQFTLTKSKLKETDFKNKIIYEVPRKHLTSFKTIEGFARYFPNLLLYGNQKSIEIIKELSINQKINEYLQYIEERIAQLIVKYENLYMDKIKDYIMNKIYPKIYPSETSKKDDKFFEKAKTLSWVEPNMFLNKDYIFDIMMPDILKEFNQINILSNPFKKLSSVKKIMGYIDKLIKFNEGIDKEIGQEDITPVFNYVFIKACPYQISTNIEFVKAFLENNGLFENSIANFESMIDIVINSTAESFNLTEEEFKQKCEKENAYNDFYNDYGIIN